MNATSQYFLLRIEGVNLSNVLSDTSELSVIRGSGLLLRKAINDIASSFSKLKEISTGASVGLFKVETDDPDKLVEDITKQLNNNFKYFTFVVDTELLTEEKGGFVLAYEKVIAKNRYQQFQQMTLVSPEQVETSTYEKMCCEMNHLFPTSAKIKKGEDESGEKQISASVKSRFKYGREQRQNFYSEELGGEYKVGEGEGKYHYTDDLYDIARKSPRFDFGNLNDKIALIYLDGNNFGSHQRACTTPEELRKFDIANQNYRKEFLRKLVGESSANNIDHRIFLETLLWGGDEMILVVPAGKGMETIQLFYEKSKNWKSPVNDKSLTYAGGIVFCHHKTPISQVVKSAKDLAETIKEADGGRESPYFDYLVLESIDYPTQSITDFWKLRYGEAAYKQRTFLKPQQSPPSLDTILEKLPRGAIFEIAQEWIKHWNNSGRGTSTALKDKVERFKSVNGMDVYRKLFEVFNLLCQEQPNQDVDRQHENPAWLHLVELWDYLAPVNKERR